MFIKYKNLNGNSNVDSFKINEYSIDVLFNGCRKIYRYSIQSAGRANVENLKRYAINGYGLNSYINKFCKYLYE